MNWRWQLTLQSNLRSPKWLWRKRLGELRLSPGTVVDSSVKSDVWLNLWLIKRKILFTNHAGCAPVISSCLHHTFLLHHSKRATSSEPLTLIFVDTFVTYDDQVAEVSKNGFRPFCSDAFNASTDSQTYCTNSTGILATRFLKLLTVSHLDFKYRKCQTKTDWRM